MSDGELDGNGGRWCAGCGHSHGPLYVCPTYSPEIRAEIEGRDAVYRNQLRDPEWVAEQRRRGTPQYVLEIMGMFAGVRPGSGKPS